MKQLHDELRYKSRMDKLEFYDKILVKGTLVCKEFDVGEYDPTKVSKKILSTVTIADINRIRKLKVNNRLTFWRVEKIF